MRMKVNSLLTVLQCKTKDLHKIMDYCTTSRPWAIVNKYEKSHANNKHLFQNHLQNLSPIPKTHKVTNNIFILIVDVMQT